MRSARPLFRLPAPRRAAVLLAVAALALCAGCAARYTDESLAFAPRFSYVDDFERESGSWTIRWLLFRDVADPDAGELALVLLTQLPPRTQAAMQVARGTSVETFDRASFDEFLDAPVDYTRRMDDQRDTRARVERAVHWAMQRLGGLGLPVHERYVAVIRGFKLDDETSKTVVYLAREELLGPGPGREAEALRRFSEATGLPADTAR